MSKLRESLVSLAAQTEEEYLNEWRNQDLQCPVQPKLLDPNLTQRNEKEKGVGILLFFVFVQCLTFEYILILFKNK